MCLFTHFAAGALAGGATGNVWAGAVAGIASHAVLDAIPHYDHPDWRLELLGGVLSLGLLLLMPFATWPAVIGGLLGMAPDLENLFQKLGKMKRSQFIFPTHTGLIPHGRNLGPRSLVWQVLIFLGCFGALALVTPGQAVAAPDDAAHMGRPQIQVIGTGPNVTHLRVDFPVLTAPNDWSTVRLEDINWSVTPEVDEYFQTADGRIDPRLSPPTVTVSLAVPTLQSVTATVGSVEWWRAPETAVDAKDLAVFAKPSAFRQVPLTGARIPQAVSGGVLRSLTLTVTHPVSARFADQLRQAKTLDTLGDTPLFGGLAIPSVLNPDLMRDLALGGREVLGQRAQAAAARKGQFNHFDLTDNWARLEITQEGLYRLTGQELSGMGVAATGVDPLTLRVFKGGGLALDVNPELPETDQPERVGLTEIPIQVLGDGDGEWNLDDEIRFYGFGSSVWLDRLEPAAGRMEHYDHPYSPTGVYWLTWEAVADPSPIPGSPRRVALVNEGPGGGAVQQTAQVRLHVEDQQLDTPGMVADNWAWSNTVNSTRSGTFGAPGAVADSLATWVIDFRGNTVYGTGSGYVFVADGYLNDDTADLRTTSFVRSDQDDSLRCRLVGLTDTLGPGENKFTLRNSGASPKISLILDSFDVAYWSHLDLAAHPGQLIFCLWQEQAAGAGRHDDLRLAAAPTAAPLLWDVTDPAASRVLQGSAASGPVTYGLAHQPATDRKFIACDAGDLLSVHAGAVAHPRDLRSQERDLHYLVVYPAGFLRAAESLEDFRNTRIPGIASPRAKAVLVDDIYDNYSGGQKDPRAIRNYLRDVYLSGGNLIYACLLGNASRDYRNYKDLVAYEDLYDLMPMDLRTYYPRTPGASVGLSAYATDDGLVSFDWPGPGELDIPDVAVGRLPAMTIAEISAMVQRTIDYAGAPEPGLWRNHALLAADDCNRPENYPYPTTGFETFHTREAEALSGRFFPRSVDVGKIYGVDYDFPPGSQVKPQMRADINARLNAGTTLYYYVGHGAEDNLADEQVFQSRDIANLNNGMKRPVFVAFSCDVGVYDSPIRRSMAEQFISFDNGGAIASICASQVSFSGSNDRLSEAFFEALFPERQVSEAATLGMSLLLGKGAMIFSDIANSQRYNLLGDPALRLPHPVGGLGFAPGSVDTLRAGARQQVIVNDGGAKRMLAAGDPYSLRVEESAFYQPFPLYNKIYDYENQRYTYVRASDGMFLKPGNALFLGSGTMAGSELRVPFIVPTQLRYGDEARVRLILETPDGDAAAEMPLPAVRSATGPVDDVHGPAIALAFADNKYRVRPGDSLNATLDDTSSIAILGTSPGNSILLEFDDTGFMTNVTGTFRYEADSYQRGTLEFPLPADLEPGKHKAALHASDALGNVGSDTLSFQLVPAGVVGLADVTVFPNPTSGPCRLIFELSDPMTVRWEIYTLAGRRLKTVERLFESGGPGILEWDGLDAEGDEIANGTYLYVLRGTYGLDEVRDLTKTGKLVIMR